MRNIALTGRKRAGKDTVADVLVKEYGYTRVAFADALKNMALEIDPWISADAWAGGPAMCRRLSELLNEWGWETLKEHYPEVRRFLQNLGSSVRKRDPLFWIHIAQREWAKVNGPVVVTDVRYINEASILRTWNFALVRIVRPGVDDGDVHESETEMDGYEVDWLIHNTDSVEYLRNSVRREIECRHSMSTANNLPSFGRFFG